MRPGEDFGRSSSDQGLPVAVVEFLPSASQVARLWTDRSVALKKYWPVGVESLGVLIGAGFPGAGGSEESHMHVKAYEMAAGLAIYMHASCIRLTGMCSVRLPRVLTTPSVAAAEDVMSQR